MSFVLRALTLLATLRAEGAEVNLGRMNNLYISRNFGSGTPMGLETTQHVKAATRPTSRWF